jgi:hypothetical protein
MTERSEDSACLICHNNCSVTMTVDSVGIVTAAWRNIPVHHGMEKKECHQLNEAVGKNIGNALKWVNRPALGAYLAGGH